MATKRVDISTVYSNINWTKTCIFFLEFRKTVITMVCYIHVAN